MQFRVERYLPNARFERRPGAIHAAGTSVDRGFGVGLGICEVPRATATDERDVPAAVLAVLDASTGDRLGTWLVWAGFREAQPFEIGGRSFTLQLRPKRYPKPFSIELLDSQHNKHTGTDIPSGFASVVRLRDPRDGTDRESCIFMNHPLRYDGLTFYQASFANNDTTSIFQVVKNPAWLLPTSRAGL